MIELGTFLKRVKRRVELEPDTLYKLITIKLYQKGVFLREEKLGRDIKSPMSVVHAGDFVLSGIDARNGAFGIVPKDLHGAVITNDFWCLDVDEDVVLKQLFLELTKVAWFKDVCQACSSGTTQRIRLDKELFFNHWISLPPRGKQEVCLGVLLRLKGSMAQISREQDKQEKWLTDLRSALLQEAISGQLTADWRAANPDVEPAHVLLERIAEEKAELIRTKQIRKEKPLPPISPDEVLFDIPSTWEWSQLGALTTYGTSPKVESSEIESDTWVLDLEDIEKGSSRIIEKVRLKDRPFNSTKAQFKRGHVLYSKLRPYLDKVVVADEDGVCTTEILPLPVFCGFNSEYLLFSLKAPHFIEYASRSVSGMKMPRLGTEEGRGATLPIAPQAEQQEIVRRLEVQLEKVEALQKELERSKEAAQLLMKSKLAEVFEPVMAD